MKIINVDTGEIEQAEEPKPIGKVVDRDEFEEWTEKHKKQIEERDKKKERLPIKERLTERQLSLLDAVKKNKGVKQDSLRRVFGTGLYNIILSLEWKGRLRKERCGNTYRLYVVEDRNVKQK